MELLEKSEFHGRLVNDLCKYVPDYLLEPMFRVLLEKGVVTDTALLAYLVPNRLSLKINQARSIRNATFRQIGLNCPNLVSIISLFSLYFRLRADNCIHCTFAGDPGLVELLASRQLCSTRHSPGLPCSGRHPSRSLPPYHGQCLRLLRVSFRAPSGLSVSGGY